MKSLTIIFAIFLCGCSTVTYTFNSDPQGATIFHQDTLIGQAPVTIEYEFSDNEKNEGKKVLNNTRAIWASGVENTKDSIIINYDIWGEQGSTFIRPNLPGREIDVNHAMRIRQMEQEAEIAKKKLEAEQQANLQKLNNDISRINMEQQRANDERYRFLYEDAMRRRRTGSYW